MEKIVAKNERDCTVILDGTECAVKFDRTFQAFAVMNDSSDDVFVTINQGATAGADGVQRVKPGCTSVYSHIRENIKTVYITGKGSVQVHAQNDNSNPFRNAPVADGGVQAEGNPIQMDGLQGGVPFSEMVVSGKNLLKYPYYTTTKTINGVTFTDNGDGTITANGTATAVSSFALIWKNIRLPKGTYTISGCPEGGNVDTGFYVVCGADTARFAADTGNGGTFTMSEDTNDFTFSIRINNGVTVDNIVFRPQLELGSTATAYEPPITGRDLTVNVSGKNLLNVYIPTKREYVVNNTTFTINDDGSVSAISTETEKTATRLSLSMTCPPGDYMFSGSTNNGFTTYIYNSTKNTVTAWANPNPVPCHIDKENEYVLYFMVGANCKANGDICKPQLEIGSVATEYEPYNGADYTITPDSNPYVVPNDIRQQDGYNVVSVSEGEISVTGVRKNAAVKKIWDKIDELTTAIIVSNGETIE